MFFNYPKFTLRKILGIKVKIITDIPQNYEGNKIEGEFYFATAREDSGHDPHGYIDFATDGQVYPSPLKVFGNYPNDYNDFVIRNQSVIVTRDTRMTANWNDYIWTAYIKPGHKLDKNMFMKIEELMIKLGLDTKKYYSDDNYPWLSYEERYAYVD